MATTNTRTASRSPVTLKIKFKSTTLDQFIERYSVDISHGGIFIRTKDPLPVGTNLKFEFQLKDASPLITGDGTVVWTRDFDASRSGVAPGMGVRFDRLPSESQEVLEKILAHKTAKLGKASEPGFLDTPTKVAFGNVPTKVAPKDILEELAKQEARRTLLGVGVGLARSEDATPLPRPQPFAGDLDEFPDEAFEEATKVAALDGLARRSAEVAAEENLALTPFGKSLEEDVTVERKGRPRQRTDEMARLGSSTEPPSPAGSGAAPIFHDLPSRSPFLVDEPDQPTPYDGGHLPEQLVPDRADPFSLPHGHDGPGDDEVTGHRRTSQRLRLVRSSAPAPESNEAFEDEGPTSESPQNEPEPEPATERSRLGPNLPWLAAAAGLLLMGGIGGFLILRGDDDAPPAAAGPKSGQPAAAAEPVQPDPAPVQPAPVVVPAPAAAGNIEVTIASDPDGAVAELVGSGQSGKTPMTFRGLVAGTSYQVKISKAGFLAAELTLKPEAGNPRPVELEEKPSVLRVSSEPAGAQVWINGRRQRSLTPADVKLSARTAERKRVTLSLRKSGYATSEQQVSLDDLVDQGEIMVQEVAMVLERRVDREAPEGEAEGETGSSGDSGGDQPGSGGATPPSSGGAPGDGSGATPDQPGTGTDHSQPKEPESPSITDEKDPIPDWMKP